MSIDYDPVTGARAYLERGCGESHGRGIIAELIAEVEALRLTIRVTTQVKRRFEFRQGQMHERIAALEDGRLKEEQP